tara:strand:- start:3097 stop:3435 length:339 start_codon:yes stop_codon:yes gene_type:complete
MKAIYLKEATAEKLRPNSDSNFIRRMQQLADKEKEFTLSVFKDTGRLMNRLDFVKNFSFDSLNDNTDMVMTYIDGLYIEKLKDGTWYTQGVQDTDINVIEEILFNSIGGYDE